MSGVVILLFVVFAILIIIGAYYSHLAEQKRKQELAALAAQLGWSFSVDEDDSFDSRYPQFSHFQSGSDRYAYNVFSGALRMGEDAWPAVMGDYHYETTSTDKDGKTTTHNHYFSFLIVHLPYASLPGLYLRREGFFDKIKRAFGFDDIDFESAEFSKRFFVKSSDKRFAYDVIHPAMMEYLLSCEPPGIEISDGQCCLSDGSSTWEPDEFRANVECARRFFELWPKHLTSTLERA
jgi:hypothetical protein